MRIVLVEDNRDLCRSMEMLLGLLGHEVHSFERSTDALGALPTLGASEVLVSDYYLPDMNGVELIKRMRRARPELPAILLTGSPEEGIVKAVRAIPGCRLLRKPLDVEQLEKELDTLARAQCESLSNASETSRMSSGQ